MKYIRESSHVERGRPTRPDRAFPGREGTLLVVNPHESEGVAAALKRALEMPLTERRERHGPMLEHLLVHNVKLWAESYLSALTETRQRPSLISDQRAYVSPSVSWIDRRPTADARGQA
jgi:hypothetical protein